MSVGDAYQLTVNSVIAGKDCNNIFYYVETFDPGVSAAAAAAGLCVDFFDKIYSPHWKPFLSSSAELRNIFCYKIFPTVEDGQGKAYASENGAIASDPIPNGSTALISQRTNDNAQNFWRRTYISGIPESLTTQSFLNQSLVDDLNDLAFYLRDTVLVSPVAGPGRYNQIAYSKKLVADGAGTVYQAITRSHVSKNIRSQRQRNIVSG